MERDKRKNVKKNTKERKLILRGVRISGRISKKRKRKYQENKEILRKMKFE